MNYGGDVRAHYFEYHNKSPFWCSPSYRSWSIAFSVQTIRLLDPCAEITIWAAFSLLWWSNIVSDRDSAQDSRRCHCSYSNRSVILRCLFKAGLPLWACGGNTNLSLLLNSGTREHFVKEEMNCYSPIQVFAHISCHFTHCTFLHVNLIMSCTTL